MRVLGRPELGRSGSAVVICAGGRRRSACRPPSWPSRIVTSTVQAPSIAGVIGPCTVTALLSTSGVICRSAMCAARHRLQPHRLPDAGGGRVPDAAGLAHLLAARLRAGVGRVPDRHDHLLLAAGLERVGDVEAEGVVAAAVLADLLAVDPDRRLPVHRAEVQQHAPALPVPAGTSNVRRYQSRSFSLDRLHHARQGRLDRERHEDLARRTAAAARRLWR